MRRGRKGAWRYLDVLGVTQGESGKWEHRLQTTSSAGDEHRKVRDRCSVLHSAFDGVATVRVWLITVGEPLPIGNSTDRLWRTGLLAEILSGRGHEVLWWTSTVDHIRKELFVSGEPRLRSRIGASIRFLSGRLYRRNVSVGRLLNHREIGRRFRELARREPPPDIIVCSFPTVELSRECVRYGRAVATPVILDIRDLWPDIFLPLLPRFARALGRAALSGLFRDTAWALSGCDHLFAVSDGYLDWGLARAGRMRRAGDLTFPLGYPTTTWSAADELSLMKRLSACGVRPNIPLATFVGTFGRTYDLDTVIHSARLLAQRGQERLQFILCGAGERDEAWRAAAEDVPGIAFPGWLSAGELACLLSRSAIGLAAYAAHAPQGIPNKVIEYLSAGIPVLCSLRGEARDLLESNRCGTHYAPGEAHALAAELENLVANADRRVSMGAAARDLFHRRFSAYTVYGGMARHLELLVEDRARVAVR